MQTERRNEPNGDSNVPVNRQFGVFGKYWEPGRVKTRLAAVVGPESASGLYREFLATLLRRFSGAAERCVLAFTPDDRRNAMRQLAGPTWELTPQEGADLGHRMKRYFESAAAAGFDRVLLIGSDSPTLPAKYVEEAYERLATHGVVLGPSADGGYYLVGIAGPLPPIFDDITWSSPDVWRQTCDRLAEAGGRSHVLPTWYDVDEFTDLERLKAELEVPLAGDPQFGPLRIAVDRCLAAADAPNSPENA